jgi:hypothetical protein
MKLFQYKYFKRTLILDNNPIEANIYDILLYEENSS